MPLSTLIEETVAPHRDFGVAIKVRIAVAGTREPVGTRNPAILYGVGNILENAVDFARADGRGERVVEHRDRRDRDFRRRAGHRARHAEADRRALFVAAAQRGRGPKRASAASVSGVFIARTLLERTGAKVSFTNRIFPDHGAVVQIAWPRDRFEAGEIAAEPASLERVISEHSRDSGDSSRL